MYYNYVYFSFGLSINQNGTFSILSSISIFMVNYMTSYIWPNCGCPGSSTTAPTQPTLTFSTFNDSPNDTVAATTISATNDALEVSDSTTGMKTAVPNFRRPVHEKGKFNYNIFEYFMVKL